MISDNIVWNLTMYVVAMTDEQPSTYVPEAYLPWTFNGSATVNGNAWQPNGAGIFYRTAAGLQPIANAQWSATKGTAPQGEAGFTTSPPQFNSLIQPDPETKKLPVMFV